MEAVAVNVPIRKRRIPFEIPAVSDDFYNKHNQMRLRKAISDLGIGKGETHELIEVE